MVERIVTTQIKVTALWENTGSYFQRIEVPDETGAGGVKQGLDKPDPIGKKTPVVHAEGSGKWWRPRNGKCIRIKHMDDKHLAASIKMLFKRTRTFKFTSEAVWMDANRTYEILIAEARARGLNLNYKAYEAASFKMMEDCADWDELNERYWDRDF